MTLIIAGLVAPFVLLTSCFLIEIFAGLRPLSATPRPLAPRVSAVVVVPAHDEEQVLRARLEGLREAAAGTAQILVVADNCSDGTAQIAREVGVDVIERNEPQRRGKGFALDFAKRHLSSNPPEVVVIIDADCATDGESLSRLIQAAATEHRPCQAVNLQIPVFDASLRVQLSTFAFFIKNVIRQRALQRLAKRVHLLGTGMAFPWPIYSEADLATGNVVEDLRLGQQLAERGQGAILVEGAMVSSDSETNENTISQRRRWEGGFLENALRSGPRMIGQALMTANPRLLWAGIDTMIPPLTLLMISNLVILAVATGLAWTSSVSAWPLFVLLGVCLLAGFALALAWCQGGSRFVPLRGLLQAPLYLAWKLPMYVAFAIRGTPKEWKRTARDKTRVP